MKPQASKWVAKAEEDYRAAKRLFQARKDPTYNAVCFHAQQCSEKYMKAVLQQHRVLIERIHDLSALLDSLVTIDPMWELLRPQANGMTDFAVRFRYPGRNASRQMAKGALRACELVRIALRAHLGLPTVAKRRPHKMDLASKKRRSPIKRKSG